MTRSRSVLAWMDRGDDVQRLDRGGDADRTDR